MNYITMSCVPVDAHRIALTTVYKRPGVERHLPFTASNGTVLTTSHLGETQVSQLAKKLVVSIRNDLCKADAWHKPAVALVADSRAAAKTIKQAVREFRFFLNA